MYNHKKCLSFGNPKIKMVLLISSLFFYIFNTVQSSNMANQTLRTKGSIKDENFGDTATKLDARIAPRATGVPRVTKLKRSEIIKGEIHARATVVNENKNPTETNIVVVH
ncbi:hypothetical protein BY996DRAFT_6950467 [Phakopsora pachyrhizi]|nr:hypothetical protein BY996DRAFT_6950467 [Phakopsora pachyrhizi]